MKESCSSDDIIWLSDAELPQTPKQPRQAFFDNLEKEKITNCHLRAEIVQLKQEKEQIKEKLNEEMINCNDLKSQFNFLHDNYLQANTLIKNREATISNQRDTIEELNQLRQKLESVIENLNDKYDHMSKEHANLTNQLFNLTQVQKANEGHPNESNKSTESLMQENEKLVEEINRLRASIKEKQWHSNSQLSSENMKAIHLKANANYKAKIERYSQNNLRHMDFLKKKIASLNHALENNKCVFEANKCNVEELNAEIRSMRKKMNRLEQDNQDLVLDVEHLQINGEVLDSNLMRVKGLNEAQRVEIEKKTAEMGKLTDFVEKLANNTCLFEFKVAQLETDKKELELVQARMASEHQLLVKKFERFKSIMRQGMEELAVSEENLN